MGLSSWAFAYRSCPLLTGRYSWVCGPSAGPWAVNLAFSDLRRCGRPATVTCRHGQNDPCPTCANTPGRSSRLAGRCHETRSRFCSAGPDGDGAPGLWAPCCSGARRQVLPQGSCRVWTRTRHLAPLVRSSMMLGGRELGLRKGGNAGSNRAASGGIFMGYGREETVYPAGLVCGGWRSATATARSSRTSTRFSWHDFLQRQQVPPEWLE
jgi:hypothetical protein